MARFPNSNCWLFILVAVNYFLTRCCSLTFQNANLHFSQSNSASKPEAKKSFLQMADTSLLSKVNIKEITKNTVISGKELEKIFCASKDGWKSSVFHQKCDYNPPIPTLAVMKTKSGDIVGAFNPIGWQSREDYRNSLNTFLFKTKPGSKEVERSVKIGSEAAIYDFEDHALWFAEALVVPMNEKYMKPKMARSSLGTSYSFLSKSKSRTLFVGYGEIELVELECWVPKDLLEDSVKMQETKSSGFGFFGNFF